LLIFVFFFDSSLVALLFSFLLRDMKRKKQKEYPDRLPFKKYHFFALLFFVNFLLNNFFIACLA